MNWFPDLGMRLNDLVVVIGYSPSGECVYTDALFRAAFGRAVQLWDNPETARRFGLARMRCIIFDGGGALVEECEFKFPPPPGAGATLQIRSWDGSVRELTFKRGRPGGKGWGEFAHPYVA